jgi:putative membrane protein
MKKYSYKHSIAILIIFHLIGLIGFQTPYQDLFITLTPLNLILSLILLIIHHKKNTIWWLAAMGIYVAGFLVEVAGINTGVIFGEYEYLTALGPEILGTPPLIGVNWLILVISTASIAQMLFATKLLRSIVGTTLMVILDAAIEPVAPLLDFWEFNSASVPTENYIAWWLIGFIMQFMYQKLDVSRSNKLGLSLYSIMLVFFLFLNVSLQ